MQQREGSPWASFLHNLIHDARYAAASAKPIHRTYMCNAIVSVMFQSGPWVALTAAAGLLLPLTRRAVGSSGAWW